MGALVGAGKDRFLDEMASLGGLSSFELESVLFAEHPENELLHDTTHTTFSNSMPIGNREAQTGSLLEESESEERSESELEEGTAETPYGFCQPFSAVYSSGLGSGIASYSASGHKSPP